MPDIPYILSQGFLLSISFKFRGLLYIVKMKRYFLVLPTILLAVFLTACSSNDDYSRTLEMPDVDFEKGNNGNEIVFDDSRIEKKNKQVPTFEKPPQDVNYTNKDGSTIRVSYDGHGNKTETRYFFNHPNLKMLIVTISNNGDKEGLVYGHNNEHKKLPIELIDQALTLQGNEIAQKVGIYSTKRESSTTVVRTTQPTQTYPKVPDPRIRPVVQPPESTEENTEIVPEKQNPAIDNSDKKDDKEN